jgi:hypothetical protein
LIIKSEEWKKYSKFIHRPCERKLLIQSQFTNHTSIGKFDIENDVHFNKIINIIQTMLNLDEQLQIDIIVPLHMDCVKDIIEMFPELFPTGEISHGRVRLKETTIIPNTTAAHYDFDFTTMSRLLQLKLHKECSYERYTHAFIDDPILLNSYKAIFQINGDYQPKFFVELYELLSMYNAW